MKKLFALLIVIPMALSLSAQTLNIDASNPDIRYVGRTITNGSSVSFDWAGTYLEMSFTGDKIELIAADSGTNYYNLFIDKNEPTIIKISGADTTITLASELGRGKHNLVLQKRTEGSQGITTLKGFVIDGKTTKLLKAPAQRERHIEFIGDSFTCGYGVEAPATAHFSAETENCNLAHGAILARMFDADYTFIANSGRGMVRNYGEKTEESDTTMRDFMLRTLNTQQTPQWDFEASPYTPDVVVIYLGINDYSTKPYPALKTFKAGYKDMIAKLRAKYGKELPILCIAPIVNPRVKQSLEELKEELGDENFHYYAQFENYINRETDFGADGHPNPEGQRKIAMLTAPYLSTLTGWSFPNKIVF